MQWPGSHGLYMSPRDAPGRSLQAKLVLPHMMPLSHSPGSSCLQTTGNESITGQEPCMQNCCCLTTHLLVTAALCRHGSLAPCCSVCPPGWPVRHLVPARALPWGVLLPWGAPLPVIKHHFLRWGRRRHGWNVLHQRSDSSSSSPGSEGTLRMAQPLVDPALQLRPEVVHGQCPAGSSGRVLPLVMGMSCFKGLLIGKGGSSREKAIAAM